jgi:protoporphyrinogen oxidase
VSNVVIIGAGLTGISAAYHLEKKGFFNYTLIEKQKSIGGLCSSVTQDGYTFDYTGHLLHTSDDYFKNLIHTLVGIDHFNIIDRRSFIYSNNVYTPYPFQSNLAGLPLSVIADCLIGFIKKKKHKRISHFIQWVNQQFGRGFAQHFFIPYQTKIFAYDPHLITASWTSRFVPETSLETIIEGIQGITKAQGYNANFLYPKKGGILSWVNTFAQTLKNTIHTQTSVTSIDIKNKTVTLNNGIVQSYDTLISTMPLDSLLLLLKDRSNSFLKNAADKLLCNSVINFNLGIKNRNISDKHWVYYPEAHYPFYRIGFPHNFSDSMAPAHCSSLYGEFAHLKKDTAWIKKTTHAAIDAVKKLYTITQEEIDTECIIPISHGYVIYDQWREKNLNKILNRLAQNHIYSIGRYGAWKYSSMQEAVLEGKAVAETIVPHSYEPASLYHDPMLPNHYKNKEVHHNVE